MNNNRRLAAQRRCLAVLLFALAAGAVQAADAPRFHFLEEKKLRIEGPGFRPVSLTSPAVADWNGDGVNDLILGQNSGLLMVYLRDREGNFAEMQTIKVNGQPKYMGGEASVAVADWNQDGKLDFLIGQGGSVELYLNTGTRTEPAFNDAEIPGYGLFKQGTKLTEDGDKPIAFQGMRGICVCDWNGDGKPDLLIGDIKGQVFVFLSKDEKGHPVLGARLPVAAEGLTMLGDRDSAAPAAGDWNGDGKLALLVGTYRQYVEDPSLNLYLNQGTAAEPRLVTGPKLLGNAPGGPCHPVIADWDNNGKLSVIVGCCNGEVYLYKDLKAAEKAKTVIEPVRLSCRDFSYDVLLTVSFADLHANGKPDLIAGSCNRALHFYYNDGEVNAPRFKSPCQGITNSTNDSRGLGLPDNPPFDVRCLQPFPFDWNGDKVIDCVYGTSHGEVYLLQNFGVPSRPCFNMTLRRGFNNKVLCRLPEGWAVPAVVDWDHNGVPDLLVGGASGKIYLFMNRGQTYYTNFDAPVPLKADGKDLQVDGFAAPFLLDWNGKNPLLLVGDGKGRIRIFNYDSDKREFSGAGCLSSDKGEIQIRPKSRPWIMDWNQDGRQDLVIIGPDDNAYCYLNVP